MSEFEFWKDLGNIFDAILTYQKKNVEFNNRFINPWIRLGNIFERQDQNKEAVQAYKHATEIDPASSQNWVDLGDAQFKDGSYDDAIGSYQKAISLDPKSGWPLSNLALVLVTQGKHEDAIPLYRASIDLLAEDKDKAIVWNRLGNAYRKLNDYENAFLSFQRADELDGENTGFHDKLDETPSNVTVVAPEEILEQMIVEQNIEAEEALIEQETAPVQELAVEETQPEIAMKVIDETGSVVQLDLPGEPIGIAPNQEMIVEPEAVTEEAIAESPAEAEALIEEAEPKAVAQEEIPVEEVLTAVSEVSLNETEEATVPAEVEAQEDAVLENAQTEETVAEEEDTPLVRHEKKFNALQIIEDIIAKVEAKAARKEEPVAEEKVAEPETEQQRVPAWLILPNKLQANEEAENVTEDVTQPAEELSAAADVTTISELPQEVAVSESLAGMDMVETFTEDVAVQLNAEEAVSEEAVEETAAQPEVQVEAVAEEQSPAVMEESVGLEETVPAEETSESNEAAYEEYLKDVVEPTAILSDHVDDIHGEKPLTKVSENGEVRIVMDTKNAHVWNELGNVYLNSGAYEDAIAAYSKAIELDRSFAWPYSNLALAYVQKERFAEAILLNQRAIELFTSDKDKAVTWNRLGNVYRRMNDYDNAIAAYQTADELDPENATLSLQSSFGLLGNIQPEQKPVLIS